MFKLLINNLPAIATFCVAIAALISSFVANKAVKVQKDTLDLHKQNIDLQKRKIEEEFTTAWTTQVVGWAGQCSDVLSEVQALVSELSRPADDAELCQKLSFLSSLLDRGRLLFENDRNTDYGKDNPRAFQGYRPSFLDSLFEAYLLSRFHAELNAEEKPSNKSAYHEAMMIRRREFISDIQEIVDPEWFHRRATKFDKTEKM